MYRSENIGAAVPAGRTERALRGRETYIEDNFSSGPHIESAGVAASGSLEPSSKKKSGLQGLAGEVLTICRRGCFGDSLGDRHRPSKRFVL